MGEWKRVVSIPYEKFGDSILPTLITVTRCLGYRTDQIDVSVEELDTGEQVLSAYACTPPDLTIAAKVVLRVEMPHSEPIPEAGPEPEPVTTVHEPRPELPEAPPPLTKPTCEGCGREFASPAGLGRHRHYCEAGGTVGAKSDDDGWDPDDALFGCAQCPHAARTIAGLEVHTSAEHDRDVLTRDERVPLDGEARARALAEGP